jgi:hypothetical protein
MIRLNYRKLYGSLDQPGLINATAIELRDGSVFVGAVVDNNGGEWLAVRCASTGSVVVPYLDERDAYLLMTALRHAAAVHGWQL